MTGLTTFNFERYIEKMANSLAHSVGDLTIIEDLRQEGRIKLWMYQTKIDEAKGDPIAYLTTIIKYAMKDYLTNNLRIIRIPNYAQFSEESNHPTTISTSTQISEDSNISIEDLLASPDHDEAEANEEHQDKLDNVLNKLKSLKVKQKKKDMFIKFYLEEMTMVEIGVEYGITKQAVSLHINQILKMLRE